MTLRYVFSPAKTLRHSPIKSFRHSFHVFTSRRTPNIDHYETLGLEVDASPTAVKRQFYMLSKQHHPDHNPNDPLAAERFVKISEAYAVLGNTQKRENYDQETRRSANSQAPRAANQGSYSSSSGPFGSRPASGLSKRRTQFRGPPPSFYRSGGWGTESSKRKAQADAAASASADAAAGSASSGATMGGGSSSAGTQINWADWSNDVPHFDREGHFRTQEQQDQRRQRRIQEEAMDYESGGSMFINFVLIGGMVSLACLLPLMFERRHGVKNKEEQ